MKKLILTVIINDGETKTNIETEGIETNGEVLDILGKARDMELFEYGIEMRRSKND
jgi:hypothetical protein